MYTTIPVLKETKKLVDLRKKELGCATYDETIAKLAKGNAFANLMKLKGSIKGAPEFRRYKSERLFD